MITFSLDPAGSCTYRVLTIFSQREEKIECNPDDISGGFSYLYTGQEVVPCVRLSQGLGS